MRKYLILLTITIVLSNLFAQCPDFDESGPLEISYRNIEEIPTEDETIRDSRCYYPSSFGTVAPEAVPCPIIVFGHGFMTSVDNYYSYAEHYASWGYVCIVPTFSNPFLFPNHDYRARLLITSAHYIMALNDEPGDIFEDKLAVNRLALIGHSMGGSVSLLSGDMYVNDPGATYHLVDTLRCIIALGSPQSNPETNAADITTPYMFLSATEDGIAPWEEVREDFWVGSSAPGVFAVIDGGNHTYFTDSYGHYLTDGTATITREEQLAIARKHSTAFLEMYMKEDTSPCVINYAYADSITEAAWMDSVETRYFPLKIDEPEKHSDLKIITFPNPFRNEILWDIPKHNAYQIKIFDNRGGLVHSAFNSSYWKPSKKLPSGLYLMEITDGKNLYSRKIQLIR